MKCIVAPSSHLIAAAPSARRRSMACPRCLPGSLQRHLEATAAVHRSLALYHSNISAALSNRAALLSLRTGSAWIAELEPVAKHATDKEQQTEPVGEMLLNEQAFEMFSRMKDVNLAKLDESEPDLYRQLTSCASPSAREGVLLRALTQADVDKDKRALLQDTLVLIMLAGRRLGDFEALDKAMSEVFKDQKYDSLWRSRFHNSFVKIVGPSLWPSKSKRKKRQPKNV